MVYFLIEWTDDERSVNAVKIGKSDSPEERTATFHTGNSRLLELWFAIPGGLELESQFHSYFQNVHIRLEWFKFSTQLMRELFEYLESPYRISKRARFMERLPLNKCYDCRLRCVHKCE